MWLYTNWDEEDFGYNCSGCHKPQWGEHVMSAGQPELTDQLTAGFEKKDTKICSTQHTPSKK